MVAKLARSKKKDNSTSGILLPSVTVSVEAKQFTLEQLWESRKQVIEDETRKFQKWEATLNDDQRRVIKEMVVHALNTLAEDPEWIPYSTEIKDGQVFDVNLRILLTDVDEEVKRQEADFLRTVDNVDSLNLAS